MVEKFVCLIESITIPYKGTRDPYGFLHAIRSLREEQTERNSITTNSYLYLCINDLLFLTIHPSLLPSVVGSIKSHKNAAWFFSKNSEGSEPVLTPKRILPKRKTAWKSENL